ncbi:hypothetical protein GcC1_219011 [Golovinomyces cichoracearum]|uniref:Uncharacterized protein n=1 Tax=Golovinomyces cichoracearum TaxID=62708 RepID=A0A420H879_9PEZI|nr:hypothetical protein GcC1_219011 [Golovinomyces cichoracearum]
MPSKGYRLAPYYDPSPAPYLNPVHELLVTPSSVFKASDFVFFYSIPFLRFPIDLQHWVAPSHKQTPLALVANPIISQSNLCHSAQAEQNRVSGAPSPELEGRHVKERDSRDKRKVTCLKRGNKS